MKRALALLMLAACSSSKPAEAPKPKAPPAPTEAKIFYELPAITSKRFPLPLVRGAVGNRHTVFILDSGAQIPVVASWLARDADLAIGTTLESRDPAGNKVSMRRINDAKISIDGLGRMPPASVGIVDLPPVFERLGIGGIVSPQVFATDEHVVKVDLAGSRASLIAFQDMPTTSSIENAHICRYESEGLSSRVLVGEAEIDGVRTVVELDTGADEATVVADSDIGRKLAERADGVPEEATSAAGTVEAKTYSDVPIGHRGRSRVHVTAGHRHEPCKYEGRLSIQQLSTCVLYLAPEDLRVVCTATPAAPTGPSEARP